MRLYLPFNCHLTVVSTIPKDNLLLLLQSQITKLFLHLLFTREEMMTSWLVDHKLLTVSRDTDLECDRTRDCESTKHQILV